MTVRIEKLVTGGQGLGVLPDGKKVFVWNALPGEMVDVEILREKPSFAEAVTVKVLDASDDRVAPKETAYISTSPWQIMSEVAEERYKLAILREQFDREYLGAPLIPDRIATDGVMYGYRNKVEFAFMEEKEVLCLAVTGRHSHEKLAVDGSALAKPELNRAAEEMLVVLRQLRILSNDLSHLTLRASADGHVIGSLTVKTPRFPELPLPASMAGLQVRFVNGFGRRHQTKILQNAGEQTLSDKLQDTIFHYGVNSFFQVNLPVYALALEDIREELVGKDIIELYAGVGSIGLSAAASYVTLIDIDPFNTAYAKDNLAKSVVKGSVVTSSSEKALQYITSQKVLIVDPPRAGLSPQVVSRIMEAVPPQIVYLSCDPATLARDLVKLGRSYQIKTVKAYNFFPRTPHIETLVVLTKA